MIWKTNYLSLIEFTDSTWILYGFIDCWQKFWGLFPLDSNIQPGLWLSPMFLSTNKMSYMVLGIGEEGGRREGRYLQGNSGNKGKEVSPEVTVKSWRTVPLSDTNCYSVIADNSLYGTTSSFQIVKILKRICISKILNPSSNI